MTEVKNENGTTVPPSQPQAPSVDPAAPDAATNGEHHNPIDPEAYSAATNGELYSPDHLKEREERQARRDVLKQYRDPISSLPLNHCWEIPGR
jgi:hypothetical protein